MAAASAAVGTPTVTRTASRSCVCVRCCKSGGGGFSAVEQARTRRATVNERQKRTVRGPDHATRRSNRKEGMSRDPVIGAPVLGPSVTCDRRESRSLTAKAGYRGSHPTAEGRDYQLRRHAPVGYSTAATIFWP